MNLTWQTWQSRFITNCPVPPFSSRWRAAGQDLTRNTVFALHTPDQWEHLQMASVLCGKCRNTCFILKRPVVEAVWGHFGGKSATESLLMSVPTEALLTLQTLISERLSGDALTFPQGRAASPHPRVCSSLAGVAWAGLGQSDDEREESKTREESTELSKWAEVGRGGARRSNLIGPTGLSSEDVNDPVQLVFEPIRNTFSYFFCVCVCFF